MGGIDCAELEELAESLAWVRVVDETKGADRVEGADDTGVARSTSLLVIVCSAGVRMLSFNLATVLMLKHAINEL